MPLTAFSTLHRRELDVQQTLNLLSTQSGKSYATADAIPDNWRAQIRTDFQCPSCFVLGAEIVRSSVKMGKANRQSFFRFTNPGHQPHCDFGSPETANSVPENLVLLTESKSNLTRAVRELVCTGIEQGIFDQASIRDMREWFFNKKVRSLFTVSLDFRLFTWVSELQKNAFYARGAIPTGMTLTREIAALPQFDWHAEAARQVMERYPEHKMNMKMILDQRAIRMFGDGAKRAMSLAQRFQGREVFDPSVLHNEYRKTCSLAEFMSHNYAPLKAVKDSSSTASVLAFSALLLFLRDWDISAAIADFVRIVADIGWANQNLGNVMGLNPFHDYEAWSIIKQLQTLNIALPENVDIKAERVAQEIALREQFGAGPMTYSEGLEIQYPK